MSSRDARYAFTTTKEGAVQTSKIRALTRYPLDHWTHLAATYDGDVMNLYVNGAQVS